MCRYFSDVASHLPYLARLNNWSTHDCRVHDCCVYSLVYATAEAVCNCHLYYVYIGSFCLFSKVLAFDVYSARVILLADVMSVQGCIFVLHSAL